MSTLLPAMRAEMRAAAQRAGMSAGFDTVSGPSLPSSTNLITAGLGEMEPRGRRSAVDVHLSTVPLSAAVVSGSMLVVHSALRACHRSTSRAAATFCSFKNEQATPRDERRLPVTRERVDQRGHDAESAGRSETAGGPPWGSHMRTCAPWFIA
jgi:hypothetical protein